MDWQETRQNREESTRTELQFATLIFESILYDYILICGTTKDFTFTVSPHKKFGESCNGS